MRKTIRLFLPALSLLWILSGCQTMTGETLGEQIDDTGITTRVKSNLAANKGATLTRVEVNTNRGVVQLSGVVATAAERSEAERVARSTSGVKSVVNNLQVRP